MNACRILLKSNIGRSSLSSRVLLNSRSGKSQTSVVPKRLFISSAETGGIKTIKPALRFGMNWKAPAAIGFVSSFVISYQLFVNRYDVGKFLDTDLNVGAGALLYLMAVGIPCGVVLFCSTLPF